MVSNHTKTGEEKLQ